MVIVTGAVDQMGIQLQLVAMEVMVVVHLVVIAEVPEVAVLEIHMVQVWGVEHEVHMILHILHYLNKGEGEFC